MTMFFLLFTAAKVILLSFLGLFLMWVLVTGFQRVEQAGKLTYLTKAIGYTVFGVGYAVDVWCNLLCTLVFCDMIREFTVSERLRRLVRSPPGWRQKLAVWFAKTLINPFSNGYPHINLP